MPFYTTISKCYSCPLLNRDLLLTGKYRLIEDSSSPHKATFCYATCPIIENSRLPISEQCEEYKYYRCTYENCDYQKAFPPSLDAI